MNNRNAFVYIPADHIEAAEAFCINPLYEGGEGTFSRRMAEAQSTPWDFPDGYAGCGQPGDELVAAMEASRVLWDMAEAAEIPVEDRGPLVLPFEVLDSSSLGWDTRFTRTPPLFFVNDPEE